jgi:hypothetical protein
MITVSLGWGRQSFCLLTMSVFGDLPPIDFAVYADTTHESKLTYEFAARWTPWLQEHGIVVVIVGSHPKMAIVDKYGGCQLPCYTLNERGVGRIRRQCTHEWKIRPIRQWLQANRNKKSVEQWIGISLDEFQRMKPSNVKYITHRWPLIEKRMTRYDCELYLAQHGIEIPPKSACTFCPFHNTAEWRQIKTIPEDWEEATTIDRAIRKVRPPWDLFVHPSCKPLEEVDLRTDQDRGQLQFEGWDAECTGLCGV